VYREEEREMIPLCIDQGVGVIPWSPLARGLLAGNRGRGGEKRTLRANNDEFGDSLYTDEDFAVADAVVEVAGEKGVEPAQVALAWLLSRPGVTAPILGATKVEHLEDGLGALDVALTDDEIKRVEAPYRPHPIRGHR
jgi:aryl-alcohol dehydrogenase-like predicted oxidoreductase